MTYKLILMDTIKTSAQIDIEKQLYRHLKKYFKLMKMFMLQTKGIPDFLMVYDNYLPNGWMECKVIKEKEFSLVRHLSRPQYILLDILTLSAYHYYVVVSRKGESEFKIYEVIRMDKDEHTDRLCSEPQASHSTV